MKTFVLTALMGIFALAASAAGVTGKWTAQVPGRGGQLADTTFNLKQDGGTITGTVVNPQREMPITEGKADGDKVSFVTVLDFNGNSIRIKYAGTVSGSEIKFTRTVEGIDGAQPGEFTAKKAN